ncbi:hypothetical protein BH11PAT1_BH11PAT1_7120 [soil metagenome]
MSKISFVVILVLSVVTTYGVAMADALKRDSLLAGAAGLPFKFASGSLFGEAKTNYVMLSMDIIFWFITILLLWIGSKKVTKHKR